MTNNQSHERAVKRKYSGTSSEYIDKSPSNRYIRTTRRNDANGNNMMSSRNILEELAHDVDIEPDVDPDHEQQQQEEDSYRIPLASTTHYLLPTVSSLQHYAHNFPPFPPTKRVTRVPPSIPSQRQQQQQQQLSQDTDETFEDQQTDSRTSEQDQQDQQVMTHHQQLNIQNEVKLYARYLQWEWVALELEKIIKELKLPIQEQLLEAKNVCSEARLSSTGKDYLKEWETTYLLPIQEDVGLLETKGLDAQVADACLMKIETAILQFNHIREKLPASTYCTYMNFLEDSFHYMHDIYRDKVNISYAVLVHSV